MKHRFALLILLLLCAAGSTARTKEEVMARPHEIRVGWADQLFEQVFWRNEVPYVMAASQSRVYKQNYRYRQHYWIEYQYSLAPWFSTGLMMDHSCVHWDNVTINGAGQELARNKDQRFYNMIMMPSMRITYMHKPHLEIYSELGLGFDLNGGTERNEKGRRLSLGYGYDLRPIGVRYNYKAAFVSADIGRTFAFRDSDHVFLAMGRIMAVSVGFTFSSFPQWGKKKDSNE